MRTQTLAATLPALQKAMATNGATFLPSTYPSGLALSNDKLVRWQAQTPKARPNQPCHAPQTTDGATIDMHTPNASVARCGHLHIFKRSYVMRALATQQTSSCWHEAALPAPSRFDARSCLPHRWLRKNMRIPREIMGPRRSTLGPRSVHVDPAKRFCRAGLCPAMSKKNARRTTDFF